MKKLGNNILQNFLDRFIKELKREKECERFNGQVDIPFLISSLYQSFNKDANTYKEFVQDLCLFPDYNIAITDSKNDYNGIIDVDIFLVKFPDNNENEQYYMSGHSPDYNYQLRFTYDERDYGYCQCTPDMPDYREDKHCCGHGCDASFCEFSLHKVLDIVSHSWDGDEHDYWEFEDEFYLSDKELADKKREEDKEREIEELKKSIEADQKRLAELEGNR